MALPACMPVLLKKTALSEVQTELFFQFDLFTHGIEWSIIKYKDVFGGKKHADCHLYLGYCPVAE